MGFAINANVDALPISIGFWSILYVISMGTLRIGGRTGMGSLSAFEVRRWPGNPRGNSGFRTRGRGFRVRVLSQGRFGVQGLGLGFRV